MNGFLTLPRGGSFLGAPSWRAGQACDVAVLGCPLDIGMAAGGRSAAGAPRALRQASQVYAVDRETTWPGWYDYALKGHLLAGVSFADAGDLAVDSSRAANALEALPQVIRALAKDAKVVLLLGGDHSLTYWSVQAFADERPSLFFLDAHEDATDKTENGPHAGNVVSYLEESDGLAGIVQFGLRGMVPATRRSPAPSRTIAVDTDAAANAVRSLAAPTVIVSVDVDVLDPTFLRAVASPSPGGLSPAEVLAAMTAVASTGARPRLVEFMEFAPETREDPVQAFLLVQLMLRSLHQLMETP